LEVPKGLKVLGKCALIAKKAYCGAGEKRSLQDLTVRVLPSFNGTSGTTKGEKQLPSLRRLKKREQLGEI